MEAIDNKIYKAIIRSQTMTHYDIGHAIHTMYSNNYICKQITPRRYVWYERNNVEEAWRETTEALIRHKLSTDVAKKYTMTAKFLYDNAFSDDNELVKLHYLEIASKLIKISVGLKNIAFRNNIIKTLYDMFEFNRKK
jgi:hypothetical protein